MFAEAATEKTVDLHAILLHKQDRLVNDLASARKLLTHPGAKGEVSEEDWREVIDDFLPNRYTVSTKTHVIDHEGGQSHLIDLVVHDRHFCPLFFEEGGVKLIPAESVFAAFEVKQELDKGVIDYAHAKVASVRERIRTNTTLVDRGEEREPRKPFEIIGGVLALQSSWSPKFGTHLTHALTGANETQRLDLGCAVQDGAFEIFRNESGISNIEIAEEAALVFFLLRLFARLQKIGSPMGIDLRAYSRPLAKPASVVEESA